MSIDRPLAVQLTDSITVRHTTGYSPFWHMFAQDALLPIERENIPMNTNNQIQGIEDTA